jgi:hypothetical protein
MSESAYTQPFVPACRCPAKLGLKFGIAFRAANPS